jgi:DNA gyrase inhibitor GyrI
MFSIVNRKNIDVMCVETHDGVRGSSKAFKKLESKLSTLKQRKFYGVLQGKPDDGIYRACVERVIEDDRFKNDLDKWVIPGGKYARAKIKNWEENTDVIGSTFSEMAHQFQIDGSRPVIEFYRSQKELLLFSPI